MTKTSVPEDINIIKNYFFPSINTELTEKGYATIKQEVPTRFNSRLAMYSSILSSMEGLKELLPAKGKRAVLYILDSPLLREVIDLLKPLEEASNAMSASKCPTLFLKVLWKVELTREYRSKSVDNEISEPAQKVSKATKFSIEKYLN